jgi:hypothetical protein
MQVTVSKIAALLLALAYIAAAWVSTNSISIAAMVTLGVALPLILIWFPDEVESSLRLWRSQDMAGLNNPSPAWLVALLG